MNHQQNGARDNEENKYSHKRMSSPPQFHAGSARLLDAYHESESVFHRLTEDLAKIRHTIDMRIQKEEKN